MCVQRVECMHGPMLLVKRPQLNCLIQLYVCSCLLHTTHINYPKFGYYYKTLSTYTLLYSLCACTHAHTHAKWDEARSDVAFEMCFRYEAKRQSQPMATKLTTTERQPSGSVVHQNISSIIHNLNAAAGVAGASAFFFFFFFRCFGQNSSPTSVKCLMHCINTIAFALASV